MSTALTIQSFIRFLLSLRMKYIFCLLCIGLLHACENKYEKCTPDFFKNYQQNQLFGCLSMTPVLLESADSFLCCYKIEFPFWENTDQPKKSKYILQGYFAMIDHVICYSLSDSSRFDKMFDFSPNLRVDIKDTFWVQLNTYGVVKEHRVLLERIDYHRSIDSMIYTYKIFDVPSLTEQDNLTLLVSPKFGIIGSYVSFVSRGEVTKGKEYILTYIGDILPYNLFHDKAVFEKFQGYE